MSGANHIIRCSAALAGASYMDVVPSDEQRDIWREMAAEARRQFDEMNAALRTAKSTALEQETRALNAELALEQAQDEIAALKRRLDIRVDGKLVSSVDEAGGAS